MELEELYSLLPEGSFSDFNSFASFVNENGAAAFYPLVDSSIYPTEESFTETLKKKDLSKDMDSFGGDGLSDSFTITRDGDFSTIEYDPYKNFSTLNPKSEFDKKFTANTRRLASGIVRLPLFLQEVGGSIRGTFDERYGDFLADMSVEEREDYYGATGLTDFSNQLLTEAEEIESTMKEFETSITEDFGALKLGQALSRTFAEVGGALPSVAMVLSNPYGFAMLGAGSAAEKSRSIQEMAEMSGEGGGLELKQTMNAIGTGIAEGAFELITRGLGKNMFKVLRQLPKEQAEYTIKKVATEYVKGFGMEGASESLTLGTESVLDALLLDDEAAFEKSWYEYMDTFLIGGVVGSGMSGGAASVARLRQKRQAAKLQDKLSATKYEKLEQPFLSEDFIIDTDIETIINIPNSEEFLKGTLQGQVKRGDITQEQMDEAMAKYTQSIAVYNRVSDLGIAPDKMNEALRLVQKKLDLQKLVADKDDAASESQREEIASIDDRLKVISKESKGTPTEQDVKDELEAKDEQQQTYTLPDIVEQAKEDFEIIDNRGGRAGLEILEEGNGKWYIENKRTGTQLTFKRKADAQNELKEIINGRSSFEFGEGEVIEEDITTTPTTTEIETVVEETTPDNIVVRKNKVLRRLTDEKLTPDVRRQAFRNLIKRLRPVGKIAARSANKLIKEVEKLDFSKPIQVQQTLDNIIEAFETSKRKQQVAEATSLFQQIQTRKGRARVIAESKQAAEAFLKINLKEVTDIADYINKATELAQGLLPSTTRDGTVNQKRAAVLQKINEYTEAELKEQRENLIQIEKDAFEELTGKSADELSLVEIRRVLNEVENIKEKSSQDETIDFELGTNVQQLQSSLRNAVEIAKRLINNQFDTGINLFTGQELDISEADRKLVEEFLDLDISDLSRKDALVALDSLTEFVTNGSTGGMQFIVDNIIGKENAKTLKEEGVKSKPLMALLTDTVPVIKKFALLRGWANNIATFPAMTELMFRGQEAANKFMNVSGLQTLFNNVADARTKINNIEEEFYKLYNKKKPNGKSFSNAENIYERGILSSMRRTIVGDVTKQQIEFERKKRLIKQSIDNLKRAAKTLNTRGKQAELYQQVYDKLLKGANTIQEVEDRAAAVNLDAVQWMTNKWSEYYPELRDVSLKIYNTVLDEDINYTPDTISSLELDRTEDIDRPIYESPEYLNNRRLYNDKTGVLKENKRINSLGDNRFVNLDFDRANINALRKAIININSASVIQQLQGFIKSDSFKDIIPDETDQMLFKNRLRDYIADQRGIKFTSQTQRTASEAIDKIASIPIARALVSGGQFIKQLTPIVSTFFTTGPINTLEGMRLYYNPEVRQWLKDAGYSISNRGIAAEALLDNAQKSLEKTRMDSDAEVVLEKLDNVSRAGLKYTLQSADILAAKTTWMANYVKKMKELGFNEVSDPTFDWSKHEVNKEAADFAQQQTDRQQNVSDAALQGAMFRNRSVIQRALLQTFLPFSNFLLNMKTRALSDSLSLFSKNSSIQDKKNAAISLSAYTTELAAFNYLSSALTGLNYAASNAILEAFTGDEPDEEFVEKRDELLKKGRATSLATDYFSPMPPLNPTVAKQINAIIKMFDDREDPFQLFVDEKPIEEKLGLATIGKEVFDSAKESIDLAVSGVYKYSKGGEEIEYELSDEERSLMQISAIMEVLYGIGYMPAEVKRIVAQNKKYIMFKAKKPLPKAPSYRPRKGSKVKSKRKSKI